MNLWDAEKIGWMEDSALFKVGAPGNQGNGKDEAGWGNVSDP